MYEIDPSRDKNEQLKIIVLEKIVMELKTMLSQSKTSREKTEV